MAKRWDMIPDSKHSDKAFIYLMITYSFFTVSMSLGPCELRCDPLTFVQLVIHQGVVLSLVQIEG